MVDHGEIRQYDDELVAFEYILQSCIDAHHPSIIYKDCQPWVASHQLYRFSVLSIQSVRGVHEIMSGSIPVVHAATRAEINQIVCKMQMEFNAQLPSSHKSSDPAAIRPQLRSGVTPLK